MAKITTRFRFWLWLITFIGLIVPRRVRSDFRQEWEAELRHREALLEEWERLDWRTKLDLLRRSASAFWDAIWLQTYRWEDEMVQDLRYGARMLVKNPGFTLAAVLTLSLGIGANTAIFGVINAVMLTPLPFPEEERIVRLYLMREARPPYISLPAPSFLALQEQGQFFESMTGQRFAELTIITDDGPEQVRGINVSDGWLETLGVKPALGRSFTEEEEEAGSASGVAIIGHGLWTRRFGADPAVLGKTLQLGERTLVIIGVMPRGFSFPYESEIWMPMNARSNTSGVWSLNVLARLRRGVTLEQARAELAVIAERLERELPETHRGVSLAAVPIRQVLLGDDGKGDESRTALALFAAVGLVLLIACANLANLLLARALARQKEMTIRAALGATRFRQIRQMLTESLLIAMLGAGVGIMLAIGGNGLLARLIPENLRHVSPEVSIDSSVLAFTLVISMIASVFFGLAPALRASRIELQTFLKEGGQSSQAPSSRRLAQTFVIAEIALAVALLAGAGLMLRNLQRLSQTDLGYRHEQLLNFKVSLNEARYAEAQLRINLAREVEERLRAMPGVEAAGATCIFPLRGGNFLSSLEIEGRPREPGERFLVNHRLVTPGFFETLGLRLERGRLITSGDDERSQPVVVISRSLARRYFPDRDPIGERVRNLREGAASPWLTIVGVVSDVKEFYDVRETWYLPYAQQAGSNLAAQLIFTVRAAGQPENLAAGVRRAVLSSDPMLAVHDLATVEEKFAETFSQERTGAGLLALFAGFGLLLATLGIFGVLSYAVGERRREIGIRLALGATPDEILGLVLKQGARMVTVGLACGLGGALLVNRWLARLLAEAKADDPAVLIGVTALMGAAAMIACYLPARRAARTDPLTAIRQD